MNELFHQYEASHQNSWNRLCHLIGIPAIIFGLGAVMMGINLGWGLFALGWLFQFIGHAIEGSKPEFMTNPIFILVGPLFFLRKLLPGRTKSDS